jgi:S-adenosylmethionine hydrolase
MLTIMVCVTGLRVATMRPEQTLRAGGEAVKNARIFLEVPPGAVFWYENANGLVEIAVNRGSAAARLGLKPGDPIVFLEK